MLCTYVIIQITEALLQQCKKRTLPYKAVAIETTGEVVEAFEVDVFQELSEILLPLVDVSCPFQFVEF